MESKKFTYIRSLLGSPQDYKLLPPKCLSSSSSSFLGSTAQLRPWPAPQNPAEFLGGFSTIFFFTG
jgi:hypothetical protein